MSWKGDIRRSKKGAGRRDTCRSGKPERVCWEIRCRGNLEPGNTEYFSSTFSCSVITCCWTPERGLKLSWAPSQEWVKVAQSCPTLCDPMDYTVHRILQARILEWVAFPFSRGSSQPKDQTQVSCIEGASLPAEPPGMPSQEFCGDLIR